MICGSALGEEHVYDNLQEAATACSGMVHYDSCYCVLYHHGEDDWGHEADHYYVRANDPSGFGTSPFTGMLSYLFKNMTCASPATPPPSEPPSPPLPPSPPSPPSPPLPHPTPRPQPVGCPPSVGKLQLWSRCVPVRLGLSLGL